MSLEKNISYGLYTFSLHILYIHILILMNFIFFHRLEELEELEIDVI